MSVNEIQITVTRDSSTKITTVQESVTVTAKQAINKVTLVTGGIPGSPGKHGLDADLSNINGGTF